MGKDACGGYDAKEVGKALDRAECALEAIDGASDVPERMARAAKASELLSAVWILPPAQLLRFHGASLAATDGAATPGFHAGREEAERFIDLSSSEISRYQRLLYANAVAGGRRRLLIVLQGMDASGKGGIVRHVFRQGDPMGIHYHGFGRPTEEERAHGFLWRVRRELPKRGWIAVFDRSHYEDVVMPRVWGGVDERERQARFDEINDFEHGLVADGCAIIKIFLAVSREEQRRHFLRRLEDPTRFWKFDPSDLEARERWDDYMDAWQETFARTSTSVAPWHVVPADNRWYSRAVVSELLRGALKAMDLTWPPLPASVDADEARRQLLADG
ncbi:polyphosphate kinase 2 family protein [Bifidobacterium pullorum subsp. saeculare]|uniref:Polyphosphate kinase 2 family protein n=1 Tax=Bifidobacterium pullorum subsp. saeculare TaxID=78257 RepID=A0A938WVB1_9BIFI|nr:PPK2 family polyphosphate kinase [Bifidobacterium pullorum]MBM6698874.1 polyphosphate kinase 2 family protein [Bifidobacterium pullorum subsp. saeculare]